MKIINLTPHDINIVTDSKTIIIEKSGKVVRVLEKCEETTAIDNIPVVIKKYTEIVDLPEPTKDVIYLVSIIVLQQIKGRKDCYTPDTGPDSVIRNESGQIIGVKRLIKGGE